MSAFDPKRTFKIRNIRHRFLVRQGAKLIGVMPQEHATGRMIELFGVGYASPITTKYRTKRTRYRRVR